MTPSPKQPNNPDYSQTFTPLTDAQVRAAMLASIRLLAILSILAAALFLWLANWQSAALLLIGSAISSASLWEWLRLITAINQRMDAAAQIPTQTPAQNPAPMAPVLFGFFARLALTVALLYGSLEFLHGTVLALAAGLALGLLSLTIEALRLLRRTH